MKVKVLKQFSLSNSYNLKNIDDEFKIDDNDKNLQYLIEKGYVEEIIEDYADQYDDMSFSSLKKELKNRNIKYDKSIKKFDIINLLREDDKKDVIN